jgi:Ca-activated chloride channel homolog
MKEIPLIVPKFGEPLLLFLLVIPALMLAWTVANRWLASTHRIVLPFDRAIKPRTRWFGWWSILTAVETIPPLLLAIAIAILAGPQRNGPPQQKRSLTNIQFAVDVSGSMTAMFGEGTRYDASMKAIDKFLDFRKGDAFGLTFFGDSFVHWVPLTTDPSAIRCSPPFMRPEIAPPAFGGTSIGKALQGCRKELARREEGDKMILLITDGFSGDLSNNNDQEIARELTADGVSVFCIIVGGFEPQAEIVNICRLTNGEAFRADDPDALPSIFKKIDVMKQAKITPTIVDTVDYYEPFAFFGGILLVVALLASFGLRYTPW